MNISLEKLLAIIPVGGTGFLNRNAVGSGYDAEVAAAEALEREGRIAILARHHESQSGARQLDSLQIKRLK